MQITDNFPPIFLVVILGKRQMSCNKMFVCRVSVLTIPLKDHLDLTALLYHYLNLSTKEASG